MLCTVQFCWINANFKGRHIKTGQASGDVIAELPN